MTDEEWLKKRGYMSDQSSPSGFGAGFGVALIIGIVLFFMLVA
jgi:hypothetical protein